MLLMGARAGIRVRKWAGYNHYLSRCYYSNFARDRWLRLFYFLLLYAWQKLLSLRSHPCSSGNQQSCVLRKQFSSLSATCRVMRLAQLIHDLLFLLPNSQGKSWCCSIVYWNIKLELRVGAVCSLALWSESLQNIVKITSFWPARVKMFFMREWL